MADDGIPGPALEQRVEQLARDLVAGRTAELGRLFGETGSPPPTLRWDPHPDEFPEGPLRFLLELWNARSPPGGLPASSSIDALELRPALGYVMLLEPLGDGTDFRYRVYGSIISEHSGLEMTGKRVWDIPSPPVAVYFLATYRAVLRARRAMFAHHATHHDIQIAEWSRVILPFADAAGAVDRLLVGNVPTIRMD